MFLVGRAKIFGVSSPREVSRTKLRGRPRALGLGGKGFGLFSEVM
jgi:hypothetical protein